MSLTSEFREVAPSTKQVRKNRPRRPAPFSIRLTDEEREWLTADAGGMPLGAFIKSKALGKTLPRPQSPRLSVSDTRALGQVLALLGQSRMANNLNQLAFAVNTGSLPVTPETESELRDALDGVREMRMLLLEALGLRPKT